jgi:hypothetical protein
MDMPKLIKYTNTTLIFLIISLSFTGIPHIFVYLTYISFVISTYFLP